MVEEMIRQGNVRPQPSRVYMNLEQMKQTGFKVSDFVFIDAEKTSFGIIWPLVQIPLGTVQMTYPLLKNLHDPTTVKLRHYNGSISVLEKVQLIPIDTKLDNAMEMYLKEVLIDLEYTMQGHLIECPIDGKSTWFRVDIPNADDKIYQIKRSTVIQILLPKETIEKTSFDSIGGLKEEISQIQEMIEKPLNCPEMFLEYGLKPPRGLLLYGPPGTGKTLIARAVASQTNAHVIIINGPEILSKFYGDTETKLKQIFEEARLYQPTIIFFDELDSICPNRDDTSNDLEKRVVGCLLSLMDGGIEQERIIVIGATNRPDSIDPALRRPGRFDREFEIGIPNAKARTEILTKMVSKMNHSLELKDINEIAESCHGYVGADLGAVCREGGLIALERFRKQKLLNDELLSLEELVVTKKDLISGMARVKPSVVREVLVQVPRVYWDDIGGQDDVKQRLKEAVEWPLKNPELFRKFDIRPPKGLLLYGPPGCSKTLMAKALATESGLNFLAVKGPELFSKWVGESEKAVQKIFKKARQASPSIIFFVSWFNKDEIDALAVRRSGGDSSVADRVLSQILSEMDGIEPLVNVTVIAATNRPDILDSALLRPGRIDSMLYVEPPNLESRTKIFKKKLAKIPTKNVDILELAKQTDGFSGAETVQVIQTACLLAMKHDIIEIENEYFIDAIKSITKRITPEMIEFYQEFQQKSGLRSV